MFSSPVSCIYLKQSWHVFWPLKVLYIILTFSSRGRSKEICSIYLKKRESTHMIVSLTHLLSLSRSLLYKYSNKLLLVVYIS